MTGNWKKVSSFVSPYTPFGATNARLLLAGQAVLALLVWTLFPGQLPSPGETMRAWWQLVQAQGMLFELWASMKVLLLSLILASGLSLVIATLATAPLFMPLARLSSSLRFLGFAGLTYAFMLMTANAWQLKLALLVFGITVMMVTAMLAEVRAIPHAAIDHCKTLGMRDWRITWELVVLGKADVFLDLIRQNAAVGWTLLTMVEGLTRSQGGIGALLLNQNRYFQLAGIFAIQLTILAYGLLQDSLLAKMKFVLCPYAAIGKTE